MFAVAVLATVGCLYLNCTVLSENISLILNPLLGNFILNGKKRHLETHKKDSWKLLEKNIQIKVATDDGNSNVIALRNF